MANYTVEDTQLTSIANAIRTKGGTSASLTFPAEFVSAIENIPTASAPVLQAKTVVPTTSSETVTADSGYDGLSSVTIQLPVYNGEIVTPATPDVVVNGITFTRKVMNANYVEQSNWEDIDIQYADWPDYGYAYKMVYTFPSGVSSCIWEIEGIVEGTDYEMLDEIFDANQSTFIITVAEEVTSATIIVMEE